MVTAHDENGNNVNIEDAEKGHSYYCPVCGGQLIVKQGEIRDWHFAHVSGECEDSWNYDMSEWHLAWQEKFPKECREITITHNGEKHRADVLVGKTVVEFQHSPMSCGEFRERNRFYTKAGYKLVWIFDFQDEYYDDKIHINPRKGNDNSWIWNWAHQTFYGFLPQEHKDIFLFFEIDDGNLIHVTWFPDDSNKYFYTNEMSIEDIKDIENALSPFRELRKETGFCIYDIYNELQLLIPKGLEIWMSDDYDRIKVLNCPDGNCTYEKCCCGIGMCPCPINPCEYYNFEIDGCIKPFFDIWNGWTNETDKVLKIEKDKQGVIRYITVFKNGKKESFSFWNEDETGSSLYDLVYNSKSSCIIVENIRTENQFKIGTRYFQRNRNAQIEGYFRKDSSFDFPEAIPANRKPIWYANRPEWIITWESER